jgi:hypothetical protein
VSNRRPRSLSLAHALPLSNCSYCAMPGSVASRLEKRNLALSPACP